MKILILLLYYERIDLLPSVLDSIITQDHEDWFVAFHDDGSKSKGARLVKKTLGNKCKCYYSKNKKGMLGKHMNDMIKDNNGDVVIMLCDDDQLYKGYLKGLSHFYRINTEIKSAYSHVAIYNPYIKETYNSTDTNTFLNNHSVPINGCCQVDASQGSWRYDLHEKHNIWFKYPLNKDQDAYFYHDLFVNTGPMFFTGLMAQYKGIHSKQLGNIFDKF